MSRPAERYAGDRVQAEIRALARPLVTTGDLDPLVAHLGERRVVCLGEATHGTHEFYHWRAAVSRRLIEEHGFAWIGVEGDWPDCWRINRWVRGLTGLELDAAGELLTFERWPTWMWANHEVADFLDWLRSRNLERPLRERVGFYGLDVYSLWDSLRVVRGWLAEHAPDALGAATRAWQCFLPYGEDPQRYAWSTRLVPQSCESEVVALLLEVAGRTAGADRDGDAAFDAVQNAAVAVEAERYYRVMVQGDRESWNVRDEHMTATISRLDAHVGPGARGLVWAHNTHVGDARATDMARFGMVNVGQLVRERFGEREVALVGFATHRGSTVAAAGWGEPAQALMVPPARAGSHEDLLHRSLGDPAVLVFGEGRDGPWLSHRAGHRAIGVVYQPRRDASHYVPTVMGRRYDALVWLEHTRALAPLHREPRPRGLELETEPTGM